MDFDDLLHRACLSDHKAADYLGVSTKTIQRWRKTGAPTTAIRAIQYRAGMHPQWPGFRFLDGIVITPCGHSVKAIEIDQIPFYNRLHYSSGQDDARRVLKGKVEAASKMDQFALEHLKHEITEVIRKFDWSADRYLREWRDLSVEGQKRGNAL